MCCTEMVDMMVIDMITQGDGRVLHSVIEDRVIELFD